MLEEEKQKAKEKRYTHLNAEFQRIARRDKKALLTNQCKEIEGNNRMGKMAQRLKRLPAMRETWVRSLGQEDPLEKRMAIQSSILTVFLSGKFHRQRNSAGYGPWGSQRARE